MLGIVDNLAPGKLPTSTSTDASRRTQRADSASWCAATMGSQDLSLILEQRFDLLDALREEVRAAATLGEPYLRLAEL